MYTFGLCVAMEICASTHGTAGCAMTIVSSGVVGGHIVEQHGTETPSLMPWPPDSPAPCRSGRCETTRARRRRRWRDRSGRYWLLGSKACMLGWNLKPLTPYSPTRVWTRWTAHLPCHGSTTLPNGISTSLLRACRDEILDRVGHMPHPGSRVDGEDHRGRVALPVVVSQGVDTGQRARRHLEALFCSGDQFVVGRLLVVAVDLHVRMDVDGRDTVEIDSVLVLLPRH